MPELFIPNPTTANPIAQMQQSVATGLAIGNQALSIADLLNRRRLSERKLLTDSFHQDRLFRFEQQKELFDQGLRMQAEARAEALAPLKIEEAMLANENRQLTNDLLREFGAPMQQAELNQRNFDLMRARDLLPSELRSAAYDAAGRGLDFIREEAMLPGELEEADLRREAIGEQREAAGLQADRARLLLGEGALDFARRDLQETLTGRLNETTTVEDFDELLRAYRGPIDTELETLISTMRRRKFPEAAGIPPGFVPSRMEVYDPVTRRRVIYEPPDTNATAEEIQKKLGLVVSRLQELDSTIQIQGEAVNPTLRDAYNFYSRETDRLISVLRRMDPESLESILDENALPSEGEIDRLIEQGRDLFIPRP